MRRLFSLFLLLLAACSPSNDLRLAEHEVAKFRELAAAGAYDVLYVGTARRLKEVTSESGFTTMLQRLRESLGKLRHSRRTGWSVEADTSDGVIVKVSYAAAYEHGERTENFTYRIQGRRAELVHYVIGE